MVRGDDRGLAGEPSRSGRAAPAGIYLSAAVVRGHPVVGGSGLQPGVIFGGFSAVAALLVAVFLWLLRRRFR